MVRVTSREEKQKPHKLDRPLVMNNLEEIEKKTTAASLLWNPQKVDRTRLCLL